MNLDKLQLMLKNIAMDIHCGLHSGFKPCCIAWYSLVSTPSYYYYQPLYRGMRYFDKIMECLNEKQYYHIPCPLCLINNNPTPNDDVKKCGDEEDHPLSMTQEELDRMRDYVGQPTGDIWLIDNQMTIRDPVTLEFKPYQDLLHEGTKKVNAFIKNYLEPLRKRISTVSK